MARLTQRAREAAQAIARVNDEVDRGFQLIKQVEDFDFGRIGAAASFAPAPPFPGTGGGPVLGPGGQPVVTTSGPSLGSGITRTNTPSGRPQVARDLFTDSITGGSPVHRGYLEQFGQRGTMEIPSLGGPRTLSGWWLGGHFYPDPSEDVAPRVSGSSGGGSGGGGGGFFSASQSTPSIRPANFIDRDARGSSRSDSAGSIVGASSAGVERGLGVVADEVRALRRAVESGDGGASLAFRGLT